MTQNSALTPLAFHHISVDCVVLGFDGSKFRVLLLKRDLSALRGKETGMNVTEDSGEEPAVDYKLPGALIFQDEDLDAAASRILSSLCSITNVKMHQFKAYGSKNRTRAPRDVDWLEGVQKVRVERIITIAYVGMVKLNERSFRDAARNGAEWIEVDSLPQLAFDHNQIVSDALAFFRHTTDAEPALLFDLLPSKFTASGMRALFDAVTGRSHDVRNFHKKMESMEYIHPLDEFQTGVAHRAARYYKFDRKAYNRRRK